MTPQELKYSILGNAFTGKLCEHVEPKDFGGVKTIELAETPFDVPETWVWSTLGLCCEMYTGNSISETVKAAKYAGLETGYDYIATKDVTFNQEICYDNGVRIPYNEGFKVAHKDAVLMCIEGGSAGRKIGILDRDVCFGNKLCSFHAQGIDNKYLYYYLQSWLFKELFSGNMTGIIGGVSIKKLKEISIPVAPLDEQKHIVTKIEELLPYIDRYERAWSKLEDFNKRFPVDMQKSILQMAIQGKLVQQLPEEGTGEDLLQQIQAEKQALIKAGKIKKEKPLPEITEDEIPFDIPKSWKWARLCGVAHKITDGTHKTPRYAVEGVRFVSAKDLYSGKLCFENCKYITESEHAELYKRCNPESGDLVISKSGSIGTVDVIEVNFEFSMFESLALVKFDQQLIDSWYLKYAVQYACYHLNEDNVRGVAVKHLPIISINSLLIPLPPLVEQKRIVAKLEEILPLCGRLK